MIEYANEKITKSLNQYDMLLKSLKYIPSNEEKTAIYYQMTKLTREIIDLTNEVYEKQYHKLENKEAYLMEEEKNKLLSLISLINERKAYISNQIKSNREITALDIEEKNILGEDKIEEYKNKIRVIDKYNENKRNHSILVEEIKELNSKIEKARTKIEANRTLNTQLEIRMQKLVEAALEKFNCYELKERVKEIDLAYTELGYSLEKAKENAKLARKSSADDIIIECDNMLASITLEYERYKEKKLILKLMDIYINKVNNYDELLSKRETINNIFTNITGSEIYKEIGLELNKQYNTIKLEAQDDNTLESLIKEKDSKNRILFSIEEENSSEEFEEILKELLLNEKKYQQQLLEEKRRQEEAKKREELLKEQKIREEKIRQQKLREEERNKELAQRSKKLLEEQQNSILSTNSDTTHKTQKYNEKKQEEPQTRVESYKKEAENFSKIPVIKNNNLNSQVVERRKIDIPTITTREEHRPEQKTIPKKEETIFPSIPLEETKHDDFFNDSELKNLNNYMEKDDKKSWF